MKNAIFILCLLFSIFAFAEAKEQSKNTSDIDKVIYKCYSFVRTNCKKAVYDEFKEKYVLELGKQKYNGKQYGELVVTTKVTFDSSRAEGEMRFLFVEKYGLWDNREPLFINCIEIKGADGKVHKFHASPFNHQVVSKGFLYVVYLDGGDIPELAKSGIEAIRLSGDKYEVEIKTSASQRQKLHELTRDISKFLENYKKIRKAEKIPQFVKMLDVKKVKNSEQISLFH